MDAGCEPLVELIDPAARTDPKLLGAASEARAALAAAAHDQLGWAAAEVIAARVNVPTAVEHSSLAMAAAVDMAHLTRDIALTEATLTGPARAIAMRAQSGVERDVDRGESRYLGIDWVTAGDVRANRVIPIPDPLRRGLVDTADQVIANAGTAAASAHNYWRLHHQPADPLILRNPGHSGRRNHADLKSHLQSHRGRVDDERSFGTSTRAARSP